MTTINKTNQSDFLKDIENIDWQEKPSILLNPLKSKKTKKDFKVLAILLLCLFGFSMWVNDNSTLTQAQHELNNDTVKPEMAVLADAGKPSAIVWMAANYPETEQHRLDALIAQKNPEALFIKSQLLYSTDKDASLNYMKAAASEGHPVAVKLLSEKNPNDIGMGKFLTEYVFK